MSNIRLIARMDIKGQNLIKGVHLEGLRVIGDPNEYAIKYYEQGVDEIIFMDSVASLYGRNHLSGIMKKAVKDVFIPITIGGGIRTVEDARDILRSGADKVAINTAAINDPNLIKAISEDFGSQCVVLSVEAVKHSEDKWYAYTDNGREITGRDVLEWVEEASKLGAGEILLTSVDREGTKKGFDIELSMAVSSVVNIPVIVSGGMGSIEHLKEVITRGKADAIAMATVLHYNMLSLPFIRQQALKSNFHVRHYG